MDPRIDKSNTEPMVLLDGVQYSEGVFMGPRFLHKDT